MDSCDRKIKLMKKFSLTEKSLLSYNKINIISNYLGGNE